MCTTLLQTFDKTGKSEIGLLLFANSWFSALGRGTTSANFQIVGNLHVSIDVFIIDVITGRIGARQSFKTRTEILSIPGALFDGIEDIMRSISPLPMVFK